MLEQRAVGAGMKRGAAKAALNGATLIAAVLGLMLSTACSQKSGSPTTQRVATTPTLLGFDEGLAAARRGDYVTALREFRPLAERGDANAQYRLGSMYGGGLGVPQDYTEAVRWWRKAAEHGFAEAQLILGAAYREGLGVTRDDTEAARWYGKAARQGYAKAQFNFAIMYNNGTGVPQDHAEALRWYRMAAEQGNAAAQGSIGAMYANGTGVRLCRGIALVQEGCRAGQRQRPAQPRPLIF